jgi:putative transposase
MLLQVLKQRVSRALRHRGRKSKSQARLQVSREPHLPQFWQRRFYDFNVWSRKKRREKLEYMHANPVVRELVAHPGAWRWSSWSYYQGGEARLVGIDPVD